MDTKMFQWVMGILFVLAMALGSWTASQLDSKVSIREMDQVRSRLARIESKLDRLIRLSSGKPYEGREIWR